MMQYGVLGPLTVFDGARWCIPSAAKMKMLLALLLIRANEVVSTSQLVGELWADNEPRQAKATLHVYVSQLRKHLQAGHRSDASPLLTQPPGYLLRVGVDELDFNWFERLIRQGRQHLKAECHADASETFKAALGLWRGPALSDLRDSPIISMFVTLLEEMRLECVEMRIEADLALGRHRELIGELFTLVAEQPLREAFYRQLMVALYRSERQADALKVYLRARRTLREELGLEPCHGLQQVQQGILAADRWVVA
jgi:SARP family transcriptional regulator, regulator of embCAB operon